MRHLAACVVVLGLSLSVSAEDIYVCPSGCDYYNVRDAVIAANNGDTIYIAAGIYDCNTIINPGGDGTKSITVTGQTNSDGSPAVTLNRTTAGSVISILLDQTAPTYWNNLRITQLDPEINVRGIYLSTQSTTVLTNCTFTGLNNGGAFIAYGSTPSFNECIFTNCFSALEGGAVKITDAQPSFTNCSFTFNSSSGKGGAIYIFNFIGGNATLTDCRVCSNLPDQIAGTYTDGGGNDITDICLDLDGDADGIPDDIDNCALYNPDQADCNNNGIGDVCEIEDGLLSDCNSNQVPDVCEIEDGTLIDCNSDGIPDECQLFDDCNKDGIPDICQELSDCNEDGIPDECQSIESCIGACCVGDVCYEVELFFCESVNGTWNGYSTSCTPASCEPKPQYGACCINGEALSLFDYDCERFQGTFMGEGTDPNTVDCPAYCPGDVTGDGQVNVEDLLTVIANWNNCP